MRDGSSLLAVVFTRATWLRAGGPTSTLAHAHGRLFVPAASSELTQGFGLKGLGSYPCEPLHRLFGPPHSMVARFQKLAFQESKTKVHSIFLTLLPKSKSVIFTWLISQGSDEIHLGLRVGDMECRGSSKVPSILEILNEIVRKALCPLIFVNSLCVSPYATVTYEGKHRNQQNKKIRHQIKKGQDTSG